MNEKGKKVGQENQPGLRGSLRVKKPAAKAAYNDRRHITQAGQPNVHHTEHLGLGPAVDWSH